jgi:outer membrane protein
LQLPAEESFDIAVPALGEPAVQASASTSALVYATAEGNMPEVKSADLGIESSKLGISIAKANYKPTLSMNYGISTFYSSAQKQHVVGYDGFVTQQIGYAVDPATLVQYPVFTQSRKPIVQNFGFFDQMDESLRRNVGFTLNIPIYNRNQVKSSVANAQIAADRARLNAQITRNTLRQTIEQAYQDMVAAGQTYVSNKKQVEALEETFRVTQERFNLGLANMTDFAVAQNNLNGAKANLVRAKYDYIFKTKIIDFYMGKPVKIE